LNGPPFHRGFGSILQILLSSTHQGINELVWLSFAIVVLVMLVVFFKRMQVSHWLLSMCFLLVPLSTGISGTGRYTLVIFPLFLLLAQLTESPTIHTMLMVLFALLQGCFMVLWALPVMA
jgi:hypothetical protein